MLRVKRRKIKESVCKLESLPLPITQLSYFLNRGYTQKQLANMLGISQPMLNLILHNKRKFVLPRKILEPVINDIDRQGKLSWLNLAIETAMKETPRAVLSLLPDGYIRSNGTAIKQSIIEELTAQLFPEPPGKLA